MLVAEGMGEEILRCSIGIQKNVSIFKVFRVGACLKVLFKRVSALDGGDGSSVDRRVGSISHTESDVAVMRFSLSVTAV